MARLPERMMLRGGTFYCRVWVPNDMAPLIGRQLVVTSLRTKDPKIARTRLARKTVELDDVFEKARAGSISAAHAAQTPETDLRIIAREHASAVVEKAYVDQAVLFDRAAKDPEQLLEPWKRWLPWLAAATGSRIKPVALPVGNAVAGSDRLLPTRQAPVFLRQCRPVS